VKGWGLHQLEEHFEDPVAYRLVKPHMFDTAAAARDRRRAAAAAAANEAAAAGAAAAAAAAADEAAAAAAGVGERPKAVHVGLAEVAGLGQKRQHVAAPLQELRVQVRLAE
jgi:hypothetical protein